MSKKLVDITLEYVKLRDRKEELNDEIKMINARQQEIATDFLDYFDREECQRATFRGWTVYQTKAVVPSIKNWDEFWKFVLKNKADHLIERRASVTGCRELFTTKGKIPGIEPFERITIGVRKS
jgi:hypothetical protein